MHITSGVGWHPSIAAASAALRHHPLLLLHTRRIDIAEPRGVQIFDRRSCVELMVRPRVAHRELTMRGGAVCYSSSFVVDTVSSAVISRTQLVILWSSILEAVVAGIAATEGSHEG